MKLNNYWFLALTALLLKSSEGATVFVCEGEEFLQTCGTNEIAFSWEFAIRNNRSEARSVLVSQSLAEPSPPRYTANGVHFEFSKSSNSSHALVSTMLIRNVTTYLNGTTVNCSLSSGTYSTIINVIKAGAPNSSMIALVTEHFEAENVTAVFEWKEEKHVTYELNVTVLDPTPPTSALKNVTGSNLQLILSYNTMYRVSFVASRCGLSSTTNTIIHHAKCGYPLTSTSDTSSVLVTGYSDPALVGTNITISCPVGDGHTGNVTMVLTCTNDGQWDPDPQLIGCGGHGITRQYTSTTSESPGVDIGDCSHDNGKMNNMCTVTVPSISPVSTGTSKIAIISSSLTVGIIIIVCIIIFIIMFVGIRVKNKVENDRTKSIPSNAESHNDQDCNTGEYSLLQHSLRPQALECTPQPSHGSSNLETGHERTLVYADIGPLSSRQRPHIMSTVLDDNSRVEYSQVKFTSSSRSLSKVQYNSKDLVKKQQTTFVDDSLDLDCLLIQIKPDVTMEWYKLGQALGIAKQLLDSYLPYPPEQNIVEVCDNWLRNHTGKPTWREVAEALRRINFQQLAFAIEKSYETGKLPKETANELDEADKSESPPPIPPKLY